MWHLTNVQAESVSLSTAGYMVNVWMTVYSMSHCVVPQPAGSNGRLYIINEDVSAHWPSGLEVLGLFSQQEGRGRNGQLWYITGGTWPLTHLPVTFPCSHPCATLYNKSRIWVLFLHAGYILATTYFLFNESNIKRRMTLWKCMKCCNNTLFFFHFLTIWMYFSWPFTQASVCGLQYYNKKYALRGVKVC